MLALLFCAGTAIAGSPPPVALISPWIDRHDRIEENLRRLSPALTVERFDLERSGRGAKESWAPAFGFSEVVDLDRRLVILENASPDALNSLRSPEGRPFAEALLDWVRAGGTLLIVGGSPAIDAYADTPMARAMGFRPSGDERSFRRKNRREIRLRDDGTAFVEHLHAGRVDGADVVLEAGGSPFLIENTLGSGSVKAVLSGAQGALRRDGGEPEDEWFASEAWAEELRRVVLHAYRGEGFVPELGPPLDRPAFEVPPFDAFDVRFFQIVNRPHPFSLAPGEAYDVARELRSRGFTSAVFGVSASRPLDDRRAMEEIARAGLRIVYYDGVRPNSPKARFWKDSPAPPRARAGDGKGTLWDIHAPSFRQAGDRLLEGRPSVRDLPLRAVQLIEEFRDDSAAPALRMPASPGEGSAPDARLARLRSRGEETAATLTAFRHAGERLFPGLPHSTYWPGSYWARPQHYAYPLSSLATVVDEVLGPGYGYTSSQRDLGPESVRWSANGGWSALQLTDSDRPHLAVYAMGRPLGERGKGAPDPASWRETAWTAMSHGATGLAYWALPRGSLGAPLASLHAEFRSLGPWLAAMPRSAAPVALVASWTSRTSSRDAKAARAFNRCLKEMHRALELGFEDVDLVLEEQLPSLSESTRALVLVGSPALAPEAASALESFLGRGGRLLIDGESAKRAEPGGERIDFDRSSGVLRLPLDGGCSAARFSARRLAGVLESALRESGVEPRVHTDGLDTAAAVRGDDELLHVYFMNHTNAPVRPVVELGESIGRDREREWVELRSGVRTRSGPVLRATSEIAPADAIVWASVARPASRIEVIADPANAAGLLLRAYDRNGDFVADGYPLRFSVERPCGERIATSVVLTGGAARVPDARCPADSLESLAWVVDDPMSGDRTRSGSLDPGRR